MTVRMIKAIQDRISCRAYKLDPVPKEHLETMLQAARLAPSACNKQPWRFAVVTDESKRRGLVEKGFLPGLTMKWAHDAPVVVVLGISRSLITHRIAPRISGIDYALVDIGIAGEHLVLQAAELGLGTCWIGWIKPTIVRKIVGWPASIEPRALITVGWPRDNEPRSHHRHDLSEMVDWC